MYFTCSLCGLTEAEFYITLLNSTRVKVRQCICISQIIHVMVFFWDCQEYSAVIMFPVLRMTRLVYGFIGIFLMEYFVILHESLMSTKGSLLD